MVTLQKTLRKNRFTYQQEYRELHAASGKSIAIYSRRDGEFTPALDYEVFIIPVRKHDITTPSGIVIPAGEKFPGNEEFATTVKAAAVADLATAHKKLNEFKKYLDDKISEATANS